MSGGSSLDIRLPIGGLFAVLGLMLSGYGVLTAHQSMVYARSLGINVNLWWGLIMLAFGTGLLLSARFYAKPTVRPATQSPEGAATEAWEQQAELEK